MKYHNKKVIIDNIKFDSKREAGYYCTLKFLKSAGTVVDFKMQVKYLLIPSQKRDGKVLERPCTYKADFVVTYRNGITEVVDVKGMRTEVYKIKRKLMLQVHNIEIKEM